MPTETSSADARSRLLRLQSERFEVSRHASCPTYLGHLDAAIAGARTTYVTAAVTEIASLRRTLGAALTG
jgi:hypothetical protein